MYVKVQCVESWQDASSDKDWENNMIWDYMYLIQIIFFVMRQDLFPKLHETCCKRWSA